VRAHQSRVDEAQKDDCAYGLEACLWEALRDHLVQALADGAHVERENGGGGDYGVEDGLRNRKMVEV